MKEKSPEKKDERKNFCVSFLVVSCLGFRVFVSLGFFISVIAALSLAFE